MCFYYQYKSDEQCVTYPIVLVTYPIVLVSYPILSHRGCIWSYDIVHVSYPIFYHVNVNDAGTVLTPHRMCICLKEVELVAV